ncbi:arylesterase [Bordetella genomosp. 9]|uniref:Arylesterase n=1 Tax=Bordetella genomosp. 9 TaxID=1416803 RepID=A0A1W6Z025_9BORD|nr:arylesterase [Bordetella genomosp. 9]ARP86479.1 arylesterase [Bordetella genomosp. 9]
MRPLIRFLFAAALVLLTSAAHAQTTLAGSGSPTPGAAQRTRTILVVGDSLSAEYGIARGTGWVPLLGQRLEREHTGWTVVNASISGDTTTGGLTRLPPLLKQHRPAIVILELGSNDALRGLPLSMTQQNLTAMARQAKQAGARVLLVGMQIPPNYGRAYTEQFRDLFEKVASAENTGLVPFFMEGIATNRDFFQPDGIHPNEAGQPRLLENVWAGLRPMLN